MSDLRFRLLGPLEAERGGIRLELGPRKQRAVLALLLLEANRVVPTERLIDELWGDTPPETARSALQVYVARLAQGARGRRCIAANAFAGVRARARAGRARPAGVHGAPRRGARRVRAGPSCRGAARGARALARRAAGRARRSAVRCRCRGPARGAAPGSARRSDRCGPGARPPRRPDPRAGRARGGAPVPRALPRATDARALPVGAAGRRARRVPLRARGVRRGPRNRARRRAEGTRTAGARPGSRPCRSGRASRHRPGQRSRRSAADAGSRCVAGPSVGDAWPQRPAPRRAAAITRRRTRSP